MSFIRTYTGIKFAPAEARPEDIEIVDIAHALSLLCRANGHFRDFFSVAQHSLNCAKEAAARNYSARIELACLLHDASEAYISDITRPVKELLPRYLELERELQKTIYVKYLQRELEPEEGKLVREIDDLMLYHEFKDLMNERIFEQEPSRRSTPDYRFSSFIQTETEYLEIFYSLIKRM